MRNLLVFSLVFLFVSIGFCAELHDAIMNDKAGVVKKMLKENPELLNKIDENGATLMHQAAANGALKTAKFLVKKGAAVEVTDDSGQTPLHLAAINGRLKFVKFLDKQGTDFMALDNSQNSALHGAARNGRDDVVSYLLTKGVPVDGKNTDGSTSLQLAAINGRLGCAELLAAAGAEIDARDNENTTPLHVACQNGRLDVVMFLETMGADVFVQDDNGMSALHWAAYNNRLDVAAYLIDEKKFDINVLKVGIRGSHSTPMHGAAAYGHPEMVKYLIDKGADVNIANDFGFTPILGAASGGKVECMQYLVEAGADINMKLPQGESLIHLAAQSGNLDMVKMLVDNGADINQRTDYGRIPLINALYSEQLEAIKYLVEHGANLNNRNENNGTVMHAAMYRDSIKVVEYLIKKGAPVDEADNNGNRPINIALSRGKADLVALLADAGADINIGSAHTGETLLHVASAKGLSDLVETLIEKGAEIDAKDNKGHTPLYNAGKYGNEHVFKILYKAGAEDQDMGRNFGRSKLLDEKFADGEAAVWYLGHCGIAVKTQNHLMVFDYWREDVSDSPCLANGAICPDEIGDLKVTVFVTHEHRDHFFEGTYAWADQVKDITYVYGFEPLGGYAGPDYKLINPREHKIINGLKVSTIKANDAGVGFLVKADGVELYHAGDHAGWREGERPGFIGEIDYIADYIVDLDLAFLNVTGCHTQGEEPLREGNYYTFDKLNPKMMIPTHAYGMEYRYRAFVDRMKEDGIGVTAFTPSYAGDHFEYTKESVN
ncbi:MAG: ankyrin repeat domain-containing protein [FCB group bacterium]|nr:ankyrin repeat domain-containing protein [FCB group bacterium]